VLLDPFVRLKGQGDVAGIVFDDVAVVILTMNTTWAQTKAMVGRIVDYFGSPWPVEPALRAFPTPQQIASVPFDNFVATARLGYRAKAVHGLATDVANGTTDLETLRDPSLPSEEVLKRLLVIHGIGPYGAACLLLYLGRGDRVNDTRRYHDRWKRCTHSAVWAASPLLAVNRSAKRGHGTIGRCVEVSTVRKVELTLLFVICNNH